MISFPLRLPAIRVKQPLGEFFAVSIPASILLKLSYSIRIELLEDKEESAFGLLNKFTGTQRETKTSRLEQIKSYSETVDATFPNSIILGANYDEKTGLLHNEDEDKWFIEENQGLYTLIIPTDKRLASIIDGQHRLYGLKDSSKKDIELLCSVFLQLPMAYHAKIFMNINMNQKRVNKNLAYSLFHFEMDPGEMKNWSPDTLAVYFARILGTSETSPFNNKLKTGVYNESITSTISFSSVIDGIISLITTNAREDRNILHKSLKINRDRASLLTNDSSAPLRDLYVYKKDKTLYSIVLHFINAFSEVLWKDDESKIMKKTLGIQSLFDFIKIVLKEDTINLKKELKIVNMAEDINNYTQVLSSRYSTEYFLKVFNNARSIDFNNDYFAVQSKARTRIKNLLLVLCHNKKIEELNIRDKEEAKLLEDFIHSI